MPSTRSCVTIAVVILAALYFYNGDDMPSAVHQWASSMGEEAHENRQQFKEMKKAAFILGYTGESGKALLKELLESKVFSRIVLIGRREVKYEDDLYKDVDQKVVDFDKIEQFAETFAHLDVGFSCLGTTKGKSGKEGFIKVDRDYIVNSARVAKASGCKDFHAVSSQGANQNSYFLYPKTKGEMEERLSELGFDRLTIYRPAVLMCDREESRPAEAALRFLLKPMAAAFPTFMTTPTNLLGKAIVNAAVSPINEAVSILDNKAIFALAGSDKHKSKAAEGQK